MKYILYAFFIFAVSCTSSNYDAEIEQLLTDLDQEIANENVHVKEKEDKLAKIKASRNNAKTSEERYWVNKILYNEYFYYNSDSASVIIDENIHISHQLNNNEWLAEWQIKRSSLLSSTGMLGDALDQLKLVDVSSLTRSLKLDYYTQMTDLYSHLLQYSGDGGKYNDLYYKNETNYRDSTLLLITKEDPSYLWVKGWVSYGKKNKETEKNELKAFLNTNKEASREKAMNAYLLAHLCNNDNDKHGFLKYMIISSINDVKIANRDIGSVEELSSILLGLGDIDRAYNYINYSIRQAQLFKNRVRVVGASKTQDTIRDAYQNRNAEQELRLRIFLGIVSVLTVILIVGIIYIVKQMKYLSHSRKQLDDANTQLNETVARLKDAHCELADVNERLKNLNEELKDANAKLRESNYVKEEYIGSVFTICSSYISKLDEFRRNVSRKLKARQFDDLKNLTESSLMTQNELKEFYNNFDAIFLHVYPDFVSDFNKLLRSEDQIIVRDGEILNTELRIYALVRLGINDSVKIAEFLHCSAQTVYNNRLKTRNKSIIPKDDFAATVMSLGKMKE